MNRQESMKKCAAIMIHKAEAKWKRSPEFAAQWAAAERTRRVS